ncbi:MAG: hypothetical protein LUQ16_03060 [Methanomassiliicoccales archaeon]|nr:hypothetical protein [Methanomassiliicoccales archaeon]
MERKVITIIFVITLCVMFFLAGYSLNTILLGETTASQNRSSDIRLVEYSHSGLEMMERFAVKVTNMGGQIGDTYLNCSFAWSFEYMWGEKAFNGTMSKTVHVWMAPGETATYFVDFDIVSYFMSYYLDETLEITGYHFNQGTHLLTILNHESTGYRNEALNIDSPLCLCG